MLAQSRASGFGLAPAESNSATTASCPPKAAAARALPFWAAGSNASMSAPASSSARTTSECPPRAAAERAHRRANRPGSAHEGKHPPRHAVLPQQDHPARLRQSIQHPSRESTARPGGSSTDSGMRFHQQARNAVRAIGLGRGCATRAGTSSHRGVATSLSPVPVRPKRSASL